MSKKNPLNFWDLVSPSTVEKPGDFGFSTALENMGKNLNIQFDKRTWSILIGKILGIVYVYLLAYILYYIIINMNKSSEMMNYIGVSIFLWTAMLGVLMFYFS